MARPHGPFFYTQNEIRGLVAYMQRAARDHRSGDRDPRPLSGGVGGVSGIPPAPGARFEVRTRCGVEPDISLRRQREAFGFVQDILREVTELFAARVHIHTGGDEAPRDRLKQCPKWSGEDQGARFEGRGALQRGDLTVRWSAVPRQQQD